MGVRGRQVNLQMCRSYADLTAVSRMCTEYLFLFIFGVLYVILGCWKAVPKSSYLIKKFAHVFSHPASADLNPCPFVLVVVSCCCCSSAYCYPAEGKLFPSAGGVPGLEPVFVTLAAICCSCCRCLMLGSQLPRGNSRRKITLKKPQEFTTQLF